MTISCPTTRASGHRLRIPERDWLMSIRLLNLVGILCLAGSLARADDPVFSGPQPGEKLTPFRVRAFSGPQAGEEVELPAPLEGKPTVLVFVHEITRPALQLIRPIDHYGAKWADRGLATRVVWLAADPAEAEAFLTRARGSLKLEFPGGHLAGRGRGARQLRPEPQGDADDPGREGRRGGGQLRDRAAQRDRCAAGAGRGREAGGPARPHDRRHPGRGRNGPGWMARQEPPRDAAPPGGPSPDEVAGRIAALEAQVDALTEALNEARARIAKLEGAPPPTPIPARVGGGTPAIPSCSA